MKKNNYSTAYEKYFEIAQIISRQCSELEDHGLSPNRRFYNWNGLTVEIEDGKEVRVSKPKSYHGRLAFTVGNKYGYNSNCDFRILGEESYDYSLQVVYDNITPSNSFCDSKYQDMSKYNLPEDQIGIIPDDITAIIQAELDSAQQAKPEDEFDRKLNETYIANLQEGLDFMNTILELTKSERTQEEKKGDIQQETSEEKTGAEKIIGFMEQNNLEPHDLTLALSMTLARTADKTKAEQHIIGQTDIGKESPENAKSEH